MEERLGPMNEPCSTLTLRGQSKEKEHIKETEEMTREGGKE